MPRPSRAQRFLSAHSAIERQLRAVVAADTHLRFYNLVDQAALVSPAVEAHKYQLKEFADLRNAIAHGDPLKPLADPYERTVRQIEAIAAVILAPPLLVDVIDVASVKTCVESDRLLDAVITMRTGDFSQLPVIDNGMVAALLTAETVMRHLAAVPSPAALISTTVGDALPDTEDPDNFVTLGTDATVFDALLAFDRYTARGATLDAIVVAQEPDSLLRSIVTAFDMPKLLEAARRAPAQSFLVQAARLKPIASVAEPVERSNVGSITSDLLKPRIPSEG